jgi:hypothetical protein
MCFRQKRAANKRTAFGDSADKAFRINFFVERYFFGKRGQSRYVFPAAVSAGSGINGSHLITSDIR